MRYMLLIISSLFCFHLNAQKPKTVFLDKDLNETLRDSASYYAVSFFDNDNVKNGPEKAYRMDGSIYYTGVFQNGKRVGLFEYFHSDGTKQQEKYYDNGFTRQLKIWFGNGQLIEESEFVEWNKRVINSWDTLGNQGVMNGSGNYSSYHENGSLNESGAFLNYQRVGKWFGFHENGQEYYLEEYQNGDLINGVSFDVMGNKYEYDAISKNETNYQGFYNLVAQNLKYPAYARKHGIQGKVYMQFLIDVNGYIQSPKVVKGIGGGCDEEVLRIFKLFNKDKIFDVFYERGQPKEQRIILPITFKLG